MTHSPQGPGPDDLAAAGNDSLADQVILITGAGDGIGRAMALDFAHAGAHLVLIGRTQSKLEAVYDRIEAETDTRPILLPLDLADLTPENARELAHGIDQTYGRLDGALLNASLLGQKMAIEHYPADVWRRVMQVNLDSSFYLAQALLPQLKAADHGRLVFTTSSVGRQGRGYWGAYAVSKFATEGLMQTLADEVGTTSPLRVHCVNPGGTRTAMRAAAYPAEVPTEVPAPEVHAPFYRYLMSAHSQPYHGVSWDARDFLTD